MSISLTDEELSQAKAARARLLSRAAHEAEMKSPGAVRHLAEALWNFDEIIRKEEDARAPQAQAPGPGYYSGPWPPR